MPKPSVDALLQSGSGSTVQRRHRAGKLVRDRRPVRLPALAALQPDAEVAQRLGRIGLGQRHAARRQQPAIGAGERPEPDASPWQRRQQHRLPGGDRRLAGLVRPERPEQRRARRAFRCGAIAGARQARRHHRARGPPRARRASSRARRAPDRTAGRAQPRSASRRPGRNPAVSRSCPGNAGNPAPSAAPRRRAAGRSADRRRAPRRRQRPPRAAGREGRHLADRRRRGQPPHAAIAPRHRDPALARIDTPVRMRDDCRAMRQHYLYFSLPLRPGALPVRQRYSGFCARSNRRANSPGFFAWFCGFGGLLLGACLGFLLAPPAIEPLLQVHTAFGMRASPRRRAGLRSGSSASSSWVPRRTAPLTSLFAG